MEFLLAGSGFTLLSGWVHVFLGVLSGAMGLAIASKARKDLATSFSVSPTPVNDGGLIETGVYAMLRHPMYLGVILLVLGWAIIWGSWFGLAGAIVVTIFFVLKSRWEERLLARTYAEYDAYRRRVRGGIWPRR